MFSNGQAVRVQDGGTGTKWQFRAFTRTDSGDEFLEVFGGRRGKEKMRYFKSDRVSVIPVKKRRPRRLALQS